MKKVLVAGATGYLGKYVLAALKMQGYSTIALARTLKKLPENAADTIIQAEVTQPETIKGICQNVDVVISCVGITRQKDGLTYEDVDYQANANLLEEALRSGVKKFIYVSLLNGQSLRKLKMVAAKERFVDELKTSGIDHIVIRPNGFFSDMKEVVHMAQKGKVYLFGDGNFRGNPIHGRDLAEFIVEKMEYRETELEVGGPDLLTQNQIAGLAFKAIGKKGKITHIPLWIKTLTLFFVRLFSNQKTYGPIEFFMTVMTRDMIAPTYGRQHLADFFKKELVNSSKTNKYEP
jgi:uncharacterized protein YbjT (DUF2867 family)